MHEEILFLDMLCCLKFNIFSVSGPHKKINFSIIVYYISAK